MEDMYYTGIYHCILRSGNHSVEFIIKSDHRREALSLIESRVERGRIACIHASDTPEKHKDVVRCSRINLDDDRLPFYIEDRTIAGPRDSSNRLIMRGDQIKFILADAEIGDTSDKFLYNRSEKNDKEAPFIIGLVSMVCTTHIAIKSRHGTIYGTKDYDECTILDGEGKQYKETPAMMIYCRRYFQQR